MIKREHGVYVHVHKRVGKQVEDRSEREKAKGEKETRKESKKTNGKRRIRARGSQKRRLN